MTESKYFAINSFGIENGQFSRKDGDIGVQRQWCGRLGKTENCQVATFLAYAGAEEFALVDRRLYLPKEWTDDPQRCRIAGVPEEHIVLKTRHEQSVEMLQGRGKKMPHDWVAGDDEMGKVPWFRRVLRKMKESYILAVPSNILILDLENNDDVNNVKFVSVEKWAKSIPSERWKLIKVRLGHKGWHHHVALSMLSQWFLTEELMSQKKCTDDDNPTCTRMLRRSVDWRAGESLFVRGIRLLPEYAVD